MRLQQASMGYNVHTLFSRGDNRGQASVEFALVLVAFLAIVTAFGALARFGQSGALIEHAATAAPYAVGNGDAGAWADVLAY